MEPAIHFNSNFLDAVLQSSIVSSTDRRGVITFVNENFERISRYSKEELIGKHHRIVNSRVHPRQFWKQAWSKIGRGKMWRGEVCNRAKDGSLYWVDTFIYPQFDESGRIEGYFSIRNDITQRKKQEDELLESAIKLRAIFDSTTDAYFLLSPDLRLITYNAMAEKTLMANVGFNGAESVQDIFVELFRLQDGADDRLQRALKGEVLEMEKELQSADGTREWRFVRYLPVYDGHRNIIGVSLSLSDIHKRKMQEKALLDIAWSHAHEMRRPIASILGLLQLLQTEERMISDSEFMMHLRRMTEELDSVIRKNVGRTYEYVAASA